MQRFLELSGGPVRVRQTGSGDPRWVLVHGLGASSISWTMVAPRLDGRVTAIDLPGFGLSPPWRGNPLESMRTVLCEVIDEIGAPVILAGNSMGGLVCAQITAQHPDLVDGLVLVAPATSAPPGSQRAGLASAVLATRRAVENARRSPADRVDALLELTMVDPTRLPVDARTELVEAASQHLTHSWAWPALVRSGTALYLELLRRKTFEAMVERITTPTLVIWGTEDVLVRPVAMRWLSTLRPDWRSVPMDATGHAPMLERPARTVELMNEFAGRSRGKGVPRERRA